MYFLVITLLTLILYFYWKFCKIEASVSHIPGPRPVLPFIGNSFLFFGKSPKDLVAIGFNLVKNHGLFQRFLLGPIILISFADPKDIEALLIDEKILDKSEEYDITSSWIGRGILTADPEKWALRRKVVAPGFHFKCLQEFVKIFEKNSDVLVEKLNLFVGETFDVCPIMKLCALDNIFETAMGTKINAQINSDSTYVQAVDEMTNILTQRFFQVHLRSDFIFKFTSLYRKQQKFLKILQSFTDDIISTRRDELEKEIKEGKVVDSKALIDVLLTATIDGKALTNEDIREEIDTFSFAGHDTTASAIAFCLFNLAKYPEAQKKAFEEIQSLSSEEITMSDLNDLSYLDQVIKESLRMFPPVPMIGRRIMKDIELNGKFIPKGATAIVPPYLIGRINSIWENADKFIPERFEAENLKGKHSCSFIPFGAGPRNCIGQKFAMLQMKMILVKVLRNFELFADGFEPKISPEIVLKSANGIKLRIKKKE